MREHGNALWQFNDTLRYAYPSEKSWEYMLGVAYKHLLHAMQEWWEGCYEDETRIVLAAGWDTVMGIASVNGGPPIIMTDYGSEKPYTVITVTFEEAMRECRRALRKGYPLVYVNGKGYYGGRLDKEEYNE